MLLLTSASFPLKVFIRCTADGTFLFSRKMHSTKKHFMHLCLDTWRHLIRCAVDGTARDANLCFRQRAPIWIFQLSTLKTQLISIVFSAQIKKYKYELKYDLTASWKFEVAGVNYIAAAKSF